MQRQKELEADHEFAQVIYVSALEADSAVTVQVLNDPLSCVETNVCKDCGPVGTARWKMGPPAVEDLGYTEAACDPWKTVPDSSIRGSNHHDMCFELGKTGRFHQSDLWISCPCRCHPHVATCIKAPRDCQTLCGIGECL